ncbi:hypothetical protein P3T39_004523, partial [Kitasatospora sp. GP82]|nr:hypothetical protein [Kitasatospora sp. GP82]
ARARQTVRRLWDALVGAIPSGIAPTCSSDLLF